jgi:hypothetical protein
MQHVPLGVTCHRMQGIVQGPMSWECVAVIGGGLGEGEAFPCRCPWLAALLPTGSVRTRRYEPECLASTRMIASTGRTGIRALVAWALTFRPGSSGGNASATLA